MKSIEKRKRNQSRGEHKHYVGPVAFGLAEHCLLSEFAAADGMGVTTWVRLAVIEKMRRRHDEGLLKPKEKGEEHEGP